MDKTPAVRNLETLAVHGGERRPGPEGSIVFPIYQATVFTPEEGAAYHDLRYIRLNSTPTQRYVADKIAALEGGETALPTGSGMAALTGSLLAYLHAGDHLIAGESLYGGTHNFITQWAGDLGLTYTFVDAQRPETWEEALRPETKVFLVESITNPLMRVPRLRELVAFARAHDLVSIIDNTFATPRNLQPLALGFDLVFHSATKYLNGHSDLVAGCVVGSVERVEPVRKALGLLGGTLDPHAAYLLARGIKTLALRVERQNASAMALATALRDHPKVLKVNYPGLPDHPDHDHARQLLAGFGGMLSLHVDGGERAASRALEGLRLATPAMSLGGVETIVSLPCKTSHAGMLPEEREKVGITEDLMRISTGIEATDDLVADFRQALDGA
ncbi:MAG: aminotransferase class I/II-fold pyridoxal phosphate-dependent enzyme [Acidobacteriota bacterium]|jgi:cystathionine gamma-synthase/cystathionine gamma-lyase/cystathionine beta-lyase